MQIETMLFELISWISFEKIAEFAVFHNSMSGE